MFEPTDTITFRIASSVPQGYREAGTFVIDMEHCPYEAMLRRDDNGIWGKPSGTSRYYVIDESLDAIRIDTANRVPDVPHDIQVLLGLLSSNMKKTDSV